MWEKLKGLRGRAKGVVSLLVEHGLKAVMGIFVGVWVARHLGPKDFGDFAYISSVAAITGTALRLGIDAVVIKAMAENPGRARQVGAAAAFLLAVGALANIGLLLVYAVYGPTVLDGPRVWLIPLLGMTLLFQVSSVFDCYFQSSGAAHKSAAIRTFASVASNGFRVLAISLEQGLLVFILINVLESAVQGAVLWLAARRDGFKIPCELNGDITKRLLSSGMPLALMTMAATAYGKLDQILIAKHHGSVVAGEYAAAVKLYESWIFFPFALTMQLIPYLVRARGETELHYLRAVCLVYRGVVGCSIIVCGSVALFSTQIIMILYGVDYMGAAEILPFVMLCAVLATVASCNSRVLIAEGREREVAVRAVVTLLLSATMCFGLIPAYGQAGAVFSLCTSLFITAILLDEIGLSGSQHLKRAKRAALLGVVEQVR